MPAAHVDAAAQAMHGVRPVADQVPLTQGVASTQASAVAFHEKPGLHAHFDCATRVLVAS